MSLEPRCQPAQMQTVVDMLHLLKKHIKFYDILEGGYLQTGQKVPGMYYCEAYIASLLTLWGHPGLVCDFKEMQSTSSVQGISQIKALLVRIRVSQSFHASLEFLLIATIGLSACHQSV